jgi:hypothetical protein
LTFGQRLQHAHSRDAEDITGHAGQLDVGSLQDLQQPVAFGAAALHQLAPVARQITQFPDGLRGHEAGLQQPVQQQVGDPLRILHVGLAPGHVLDVLSVGHQELEGSFQDGVHRLPVHSG